MAEHKLPPRDILLKLLDYDPATGGLTWRSRTAEMFKAGNVGADAACASWNRRWSGKPALTASRDLGYLTGTILNRTVRAHRVIWKMVTGEEPEVIDHLNGKPWDNRLVNLRAADQATNCRNSSLRRDNTSGATGVFWCHHVRRWRARVTVDRRNIALGYFDTVEEANAARRDAGRQHGFSDRHGTAVANLNAEIDS